MTTPLILVDGSSFLYRAFHAVPPLNNAKGEPTNAILGVSNMLRKLLNEYNPTFMAVVFDGANKTFRHELSADYKANRTKMPDDLKSQIKPLHALIRSMGIPLITAEAVEADDVLGVLACYAEQEGYEIIIATGDKDMAQLVNEKITLEDTMSKTKLNPGGVFEKFGVRPNQIADYLALVGDSSDNIIGVPKVGAKTAAKWLAEYETLDNLIIHADEITGKVGENLRDNLPQLALAKQLTVIRCDLELPYNMADLTRRPFHDEQLRELLTEFGFLSWLKQIPPAPLFKEKEVEKFDLETTATTHYDVITTMTQLDAWLARLEKSALIAFDTETTSLDYMKAEIVGLSFAIQTGEAAYLPLSHNYPDVPAQLNRDVVLEKLRPLLESPDHLKVGQNLKYDYHVLANHGVTLRGIAHDTMLASYVLDSTGKHNLDFLAQKHLNLKTIRYEEVAGKGAKQINFSEVDIKTASHYAAEDADVCVRLHHALQAKLQTLPNLLTLYNELEMPLLSVLARLERNGVLIDDDLLAHQSLELAQQMMSLEQQAHDAAGHHFNLNSPKQIQTILYEQLNLPVLKRTPKGQPSTDESVLQELADDYELPKLLIEHRSLSKLKSTYIDKLPQQINAKTGRVHTSYNQVVTATGRLSSSDPNLQNIPIRSPEGRKIRQAFIAPSGYKIVAADYSQIELRIMAHLANDSGLISAFQNDEDIHRATASEVFKVPLDEVSNELRRSAKAINFGLIYGMSSFGLAKQLNISRSEAKTYIEAYFARYPDVKKYMDDTRVLAKEQGFVETLFGRRLYLPEIQSKNAVLRQYAERTAINAPMQGTAADIIKRAMLKVDAWLVNENVDAKMIMQVHDELVFEIKTEQLDSAI
ncbi:MAG: DNA polymerase I, partial [Methylococcales bacterium]|nr:DNA polymerase I [Methylococcales bacterium]